jgi:hypothetical protein
MWLRTGVVRFLKWVGFYRTGPRKWVILGLAVLLVLLGQWLATFGSLEALRSFARNMVVELQAIQPFALVPSFLDHLTACATRISEGVLYEVCGAEKLAGVGYYFDALYDSFTQTLSGSTDAAVLVLLLAFGAGGLTSYLLWRRWRGHHDRWNILDVVALVVLTPFAASAAALVLQLVAIVMFAVFGAVVGLLIVILGYLWWLFAAIALIREVRSTAATINRAAATIEKHFPENGQPPARSERGPGPPDPTPG